MKKFISLLLTAAAAMHATAAPSADAGSDITIADANDDETVLVRLDGRASTDSGDPIVSWDWSWGTSGTASGEIADVSFPAIDAPVTVTLTVTDSSNFTATDTVEVAVYKKETALFTDFQGRLGNFVEGTVAGETLVIDSGFFHDGVFRRVAGSWIYDPIPDFLDPSRAIDPTTFLTGASELASQFYPYTVVRFDGSVWTESPLTYPTEIIPKVNLGDTQQLQYAIDSQTFVVSDRYNNQYGTFSGRVFVYDWVGDTLTFKTELTPPGGITAGDEWGNKVALEDDLIVATVENSSGNGADLEIFRNITGTWTHEATVISDHPSGRGFFDFDLSIGNERILVGGTDASGIVVVEKIGGTWVQTDLTSTTFGITSFFGARMNDDGEAFVADDEAANLILFEKDAGSPSWSTATITEKRLLAADLTPTRDLSVTSFNNDLVVASDRVLGTVRVFDTTTYRAGINVEPVANAGTDIATTSFNGQGVRVFLNGGLSGDLNENDVLSAVWTWNGGSATGLQTFATLDPAVTSVELTITDGNGGISRDSITVDIESPPVITSMPDVSVVDTDQDGNIRLRINGAVDSQDNPVVAWNWTWPGGTFSGQSGVITLQDPANGRFITLEVIDSKGLVSRSQFVFNLLQDDPTPDFIVPIDGVSLDRFGSSVAISDGTAIINAEDKPTGGVFTGATYLSENINDVWQQIRLANGEFTGSAVVMDGDTAIIGAKRYDDGVADRVGAVRVFEKQSGVWTQTQLLEIPEAVTPFYDDYAFGASVATSGDWLAVGTPGDNGTASRAGSVFVFENVGGTWTFRQKLTPPAPFNVPSTGFGTKMAMDGETLVVASTNTAGFNNDSAVFVYERSAGSWSQVKTFTSDGFEPNGTFETEPDAYASDVAVSGTEILVGASSELNTDGLPFSRGVVYRYTKSGGTWSFANKILPVIDTEFGSGNFGTSLFLYDDHLLVGDPSYIIQEGSIRGRGEVYVFRYQTGNWSLVDRIAITNEIDPTYTNSQAPNFGVSVAHDGSDLIVGSSNGRNSGGLRTGKAFIYQDYAALKPNANYEPLANAGVDINVTDTVERELESPYAITEPLGSEQVTLDGSASTDQENAIISYEWTWPGGSASGMIPSPAPRFPVGTTVVTLTVTDDKGIVNSDTVNVNVSLAQTPAAALPSSNNTLTVSLPVPGAKWRLSSEFLWHASGETAQDVLPGETYQLEIIGYPGSPETVTTLAAISSPNTVADLTLLLPLQPVTSGTVRFPETTQGFAWRLRGEPIWRNVSDNGNGFADLIPFAVPSGELVIDYRPVLGFTTPASQVINLQAGGTLTLNWNEYQRIDNFDPAKTFTAPASPDLTGDPYQYVGMIRTELGRGSGTVVAPRVVLTAAHLFFDSGGLQWADTQWFPRQQQDERQAPPITPRGIIFPTSYAQIVAPDSVTNPVAFVPADKKEVDFAVLFFSSGGAWTGGSANYLESSSDQNWLTGSKSKHAVGYAQRSQQYEQRGRIFEKTFSNALSPIDSKPLPLLYQTGEVFGDGGASGSALFVQPAAGSGFYPAAILLAGQDRAVYRVIDRDVGRMIQDGVDASLNSSEVLDSNSSLVTYGGLSGLRGLAVDIATEDVLDTARWAVKPNVGTTYSNLAPTQRVGFSNTWSSVQVSFTAVPGYVTPPPLTILNSQVPDGGVTTVTNVIYEPISGYDLWKQDRGIASDSDDRDGDGKNALAEYAINGNINSGTDPAPLRMAATPLQNTHAEYEVYVSSTADKIRYVVKASNTLPPTNVDTLATFTKADGANGYKRVTDTQAKSASPRRFAWVEYTHDRNLPAAP